MKLLLYSLVLILTPGLINAQINFNVLEPPSVAGYYDFTWGYPSNGWGSPDFNIPDTYVQDTLMFVEDGTPGTNKQGNPVSQEGCYPLINDLSGKIAVCWRNVCSFYDKALNAQNEGAEGLIIINRFNELFDYGPPSGFGSDITIPVTLIQFDDGMAIADAMQNGPVVVFIGNGSAGIVSQEETDIQIYPNPAQNQFEFIWPENFGLKAIQLYNAEGKLMRSIAVSNSPQIIDVSTLSNGVYILSGEGEKGTLKKRVVVRH